MIFFVYCCTTKAMILTDIFMDDIKPVVAEKHESENLPYQDF